MRQIIDAASLLTVNPLFRGFSTDEIRRSLEREPSELLFFERGALMLGPRSHTEGIAFLLSGSARVNHPGGRRLVEMSVLSPGSVFGIATLFTQDHPFPNEIYAETECCVLLLSRMWAEQMLSQEPRFARNYIALLSEKILFLNRRIDTFTADDAAQRLRGMLQDFWHQQGCPDIFTLPCSYTQLASLLHIGRASLYRALEQLEKENRFTRNGRAFHLHTHAEGF